MSGGRKATSRSVKLDSALHARLDAEAIARDVPTDPMVEALLAGLLASGNLDTVLTRGVHAVPGLAARIGRRRARHGRRWRTVGDPRPNDGASMWATDDGEWFMVYRGNARATRARRPGEGWHLRRSSAIVAPQFLAWRRRDAIEAAEVIIARAEREEAS